MRNEGRDWSKAPIIIIIGLLASCISIFVFLTGKESLIDLYPKPTPANTHLVETSVPEIIKPSSTIPNVSITQQLSTPTPVIINTPTLEVVDIEPDYPGLRISFSDFSDDEYLSRVMVHAFAGNQVFRGNWEIRLAVKDIADNWQEEFVPNSSVNNNDDGTWEAYVKEDGLHTIIEQSRIDCWPGGNYYRYPIVPVYPRKSTDVELNIGILEIGVIDWNGKAFQGAIVGLGSIVGDAAGNPVFEECIGGRSRRTDNRGIATFYVIQGTYDLKMRYINSNLGYWDENIQINPGEYKQIIIDLRE